MQNVSWISWTAGHLLRLVIQSTNSGIAVNVPLSVHPIHRTLLSLHIELVAWGIGLEDFGDLPNVGQHDPDQVLSVQWKIMGGMLPAIFIADKSAATLTTDWPPNKTTVIRYHRLPQDPPRVATTKPWERGSRKGSSTWLCQSHVDPIHTLDWYLSKQIKQLQQDCNRTCKCCTCAGPMLAPWSPLAWSLGC